MAVDLGVFGLKEGYNLGNVVAVVLDNATLGEAAVESRPSPAPPHSQLENGHVSGAPELRQCGVKLGVGGSALWLPFATHYFDYEALGLVGDVV